MMKRLFLYLALLCACFSSCTENKSESYQIIDASKHDFDDWKTFFEIKEIVPLEQTSSSLVTMASKCKVRDGKVYFADFKLKSIFVFDNKGKFQFEVGKIGYSKSEYMDFRDFNLDEKNAQLSIMDERSMLFYDLNTGKFQKREKHATPVGIDYFKYATIGKGKYLMFSIDDEFSISEMDEKLNMKGLRKREGYQMDSERFFMSKEDLLVLPDYGQFTIDAYRNGKLYPKYKLSFGNEALPAKYVANDYEEFEKIDGMQKYFKFVSDAMENDKWFYASVIGPKQTFYHVFYNKRNQKSYVGADNEQLGFTLIDMDDTYIYGLVYLDFVKEKSLIYPYIKDYVKKGFGNPLLVKLQIAK